MSIKRKLPLQRKKPLQRSQKAIARTAPPKRSQSPIAPKSQAQLQKEALFAPVRARVMALHPLCQGQISPDCTYFSSDLHHGRGKATLELYLDERWMVALCRNCHIYCGEHPLEAIEKGLSWPQAL